MSAGRWARRLISVSCGKAHVSGVQISASTPAAMNCLPTMSAWVSPSISSGVQTTFTGEPSGILTSRATILAMISTTFAARVREAWSIRGSAVVQTPNVTVAGPFSASTGNCVRFFTICLLGVFPVR